MSKLPDINLPVWMNKGEPLTLAHASKVWWERVYSWLTFPLAQIDVDTCDEQLLTLLAYQRDIDRFPGESLALFRLRVKYAFVNAKDAGSKAGFARIFERLEIGQIQQLERQLWLDWDVILLRINDEQLSRNNALMMNLIRQYGRTCRRYFFDVLTRQSLSVRAGRFDLLTGYHSAVFVPTFEILRYHVNGWMGGTFNPKTSFQGASYEIEVQGAVGEVTWTASGPATVAPMGKDCLVAVTGNGKVTLTGTDSLGRTVSHVMTPSLWFVQDGSKGIIADAESWANTMWGRPPLVSEMTYGLPLSGEGTQRGMRGSVWSEWGDMATYGWPGAPVEGAVLADAWVTASPALNSVSDIYVCILAGKHTQTGISSNGTIMAINKSTPTPYRRCAVWDQDGEFALKSFRVNGWYPKTFQPTTSFAGARYRLGIVGHHGKPVTWTVTGPATITADGWVTITGQGSVTVTGKNDRGDIIIHSISPKKYFIPSMTTMTVAQFPAFLASTGGAQARNVDLTLGKDVRGIGALWNEWGNMATHDWPAVYPGATNPTRWNAKVSETSQNNVVYLTNGESERILAGPDFPYYIAAVITL